MSTTLLERKKKFEERKEKNLNKQLSSVHGGYCAICGSRLSENNTYGIGYTCYKEVVKPALREAVSVIFAEELNKLNLACYIKKADSIRTLYLDTFKGVKFRSEFKKSFYNSMKTSEKLSSKQLDIMIKQLIDRDPYYMNVTITEIEKSILEEKKAGYKVLCNQVQYHEKFDSFMENHMWYNKIDKNVINNPDLLKNFEG